MYFFIHKRFGRDDYNGTYTYDSANQLVSSIAPDGKIVPDNGPWDTIIYSPTEK